MAQFALFGRQEMRTTLNRKRNFILLAAAATVLLDPETLLAWGPATHVKLAGEVLGNLPLLPAAVAAVIGRYARDYVYGTLATDIVFAKRLSRIKQICHHWSTGFRLFDEAEDQRARAFAYGYLSHLAADTVAHNRYIPYQIVISHTTVNFGHMYWEIRADAEVDEEDWGELESALLLNHDVHHAGLRRVLTDTFLPYEINRALFERINRIVARRTWRRSMEMWKRRARRPLSADLLARYYGECLDRTLCVLSRGASSPLLAEDPSGTAALAFAADTRRGCRHRRRRGLPLHHRPYEAAAGHAPAIGTVPAPV